MCLLGLCVQLARVAAGPTAEPRAHRCRDTSPSHLGQQKREPSYCVHTGIVCSKYML